ncbi:hypothetical protein Bca52824_006360 [Brassica carinata]|uniref:Uncharacterized protein n=1 Tax=Brassica carinata TaxID=52824 RepID=A0A8X7WT53_BRACI|nr:hypothetical protein Bca52824_006360 [Brassica carinata]
MQSRFLWVNCDIDLVARMSNNPFITRKSSSYLRFSRRIDQMHNEYFRAHMPEEEKIAAKESFDEYFNPTAFYGRLHERAKDNPLFLQRSLNYQIEAKHQRRIQMSLSLSDTIDAAGVQTQTPFPLYVLLARLVSSKPTAEDSAEYKFSRAFSISGVDGQANFLLPDMRRLALKAGSLVILFISFGGLCLWSKIPLESLYSSWQKYPNMDLGEKATSVSLVEMQPCSVQLTSMSEKRVVIQVPSNPLTSSSPQQVQVTISAQEVGATENPPYSSSFSTKDIPDDIPASSVVLPINWLRKGEVAFNYRYYNNRLQSSKVFGDFACPVCSVKCASFKVNENFPAVDVSHKCWKKINEYFAINSSKGEPNARPESYSFSSKKSGRRKQKTPARNRMPGPLDEAYSVKSEKRKIPPAGAESSSCQLVPPRSPAELEMMHLWNSFEKQHRVYADGRIAWGCEEFSKLHGPLMVRNLESLWSWKKYIWTLRIHGRIDAQTLNNCIVVLEQLANGRPQKP